MQALAAITLRDQAEQQEEAAIADGRKAGAYVREGSAITEYSLEASKFPAEMETLRR